MVMNAIVVTAAALAAFGGRSWADEQPVVLSIEAPPAIVLGMPLDVSVVATSQRTGACGSPTCAAVLVYRDRNWVAHQEDDGSLGCGVVGGLVGDMTGRPYTFTIPVHLQFAIYGEPTLALDAPGVYRLRVAYFPDCRFNDSRKSSAVSNEIAVRVSSPGGVDRVAFERGVRDHPGLLSPRVAAISDPDGNARTALAQQYPQSIYAPLWRARR